MSASKNVVCAGLTALSLALATGVSSSPAEAWGREGWGAPVAAGVLGGLAAGAIIGSAARANAVGSGCFRRRPVYGPGGNFAGYRPVRVC